MNKMDGRKLSHRTLEELRIRAVKQVESGMSPEAVMAALGFHRSRIYRWLALYREGGIDVLKARKAKGPEPKLSGPQLDRLYRLITGNSPLQLNFEFALWTRAMVREVIRREFKVRLSDVSVGRLLRSLGLSAQKPLYLAYQRDEQKVKAWKDQAYPEIRKLAKQQGATIYFGDEASVRSDYHRGTTWAPIGETPRVQSSGARFSVNMISAVSAQGALRFMTFTGKMNAGTFIDFLKRLIYKADKPIFLILDGHPVHRSNKVKAYVNTTEGRLRLFVLPPYSPHLNPDEWVWSWLKSHRLGRATVRGPDQFRSIVNRYLNQLQKLPGVIRGFFKDRNLTYIHT